MLGRCRRRVKWMRMAARSWSELRKGIFCLLAATFVPHYTGFLSMSLPNHRAVEIKAFVPAKVFRKSLQFYLDIGFTMASEGGGVAYFHCGEASFLLQDFCAEGLAENFMMHLLVEDVDAWHQRILDSGVAAKYAVTVSDVVQQPWEMRDFCLTDPSGVLWRIAENTTGCPAT